VRNRRISWPNVAEIGLAASRSDVTVVGMKGTDSEPLHAADAGVAAIGCSNACSFRDQHFGHNELPGRHPLSSPRLRDRGRVPARQGVHARFGDPGWGRLSQTFATDAVPGVASAGRAAHCRSASYGLGCLRGGLDEAAYGTGTSVQSPTAGESRCSSRGPGALACLRPSPTYTLEGNAYSSGATLEWLPQLLGLESADASVRLAEGVRVPRGAHVVPGNAWLGALYWRPEAPRRIAGLSFWFAGRTSSRGGSRVDRPPGGGCARRIREKQRPSHQRTPRGCWAHAQSYDDVASTRPPGLPGRAQQRIGRVRAEHAL
jgi:hypothetical protein